METVETKLNCQHREENGEVKVPEELYRIVFDGSIALSADPEATKENLARLFRCDRQRINTLFKGQRTVLKRGLTVQTARRWQESFERTGALCILEPEGPPAPPKPLPAMASEAPTVSLDRGSQPSAACQCRKCGFPQERGECATCGMIIP